MSVDSDQSNSLIRRDLTTVNAVITAKGALGKVSVLRAYRPRM